jgi:hypothetical protein
MTAVARFALALGLLSATSCTLFRDPVSKYINKNFPPVSIDDQREIAINTATKTLGDIPAPDLAFGAPLPALEQVLNTEAVKKTGVTAVRLRGEEQLLRIDAEFNHRFSGPEKPASAGDELLAKLQPEVRGTLRFYAGITSGIVQPDDTARVKLTILPVFTAVTIDKVKVGGKYDVSLLGRAVAGVLNDYAANVSGELARSPLMQVTIPTTLEDVQQGITFPDGDGTITIGTQPVHSPVRVRGVVWLVDAGSITGLAQTVPVEQVFTSNAVRTTAFGELRQKFLDTFRRQFDPASTPAGPWAAIRKDLLAYITNSVVQQAAICITSNAELPEERAKEEVRFPDESSVDCTPTRNCSPTRACDFAPQRDTRDCSVCILYRPGWPLGDGGCAQRGNDPFCEAAKAAQNAIYDADAALKKFDCERLKEQERLTCEVEKAGEKALCETGKELLKRLARTGKFANIEAGVRAKTDNLKVCLQRMRLADDLSSAEMGLHATGGASAHVDMKFIPLDIIGHLTCQVPWTESRDFHATLREADIRLAPRIRFIPNPDGAQVRVTLPKGQLPLKLEPGPTEFLLTSPNLTLSCQGLNLLKPLLIAATPFVPALRGEIDYKYKEQNILIDLPMPRQNIGNVTFSTRLDQSDRALFLSSDIR